MHEAVGELQDDGAWWPETTSLLPAQGVLAAFTDGLVEARGHDLEEGLERVQRTLVAVRDEPVEQIADRMLAARSAHSRDDVALLVARLTAVAPSERRSTRRLPATSASVFLARRSTRQLLSEWDVDEDTASSVELVVSELVTNAARHSEDALDLVLTCEAAVLRIEVADTSHRLPVPPAGTQLEGPADDEATSGRGLVLVEALADRWGVVAEGLGKRVWAEVDLQPARGPVDR